MLNIEIIYAGAEQQTIIQYQVVEGCTVEKAILQINLLAQYPEIDLLQHKVGIFGKMVPLNLQVQAGDRVEIYRPLWLIPSKRESKEPSLKKNNFSLTYNFCG